MNQDRCSFCNKKLKGVYKLMPACRCMGRYCAKHRLPEDHNCNFDLQKHGLTELAERLEKQSTRNVQRSLLRRALDQY